MPESREDRESERVDRLYSRDRILTVPNALSAVRLIGVPVFLWLVLVVEADGWAFALLVVSGATDWLDGKLARVLDQMSTLGRLLDPLVDRLYVVSTLVAFVARDFVPWWVAALLIGRDVVLAATLLIYRRRGLDPPEVMYIGKAATFVLMVGLPLVLLAQLDFAGLAIAATAFALLGWGTALYVWTGLLYLAKSVVVARTIPPRRREPERP
nr:CDP-alcohol phosphatidyltransferase family protein [Rhodococcus rhodnii]